MSGNHALDLWESFRSHLSIDFIDSEGAGRVMRVTNTAPVSNDYPLIVFEQLQIELIHASFLQSGSSQQASILPPGQSVEFAVNIPDPALIQVKINGSVSRQNFFRFQKAHNPPLSLTQPVVREYLQTMRELDFLRTTETARKALLAVGENTTLGQLESLKTLLAAYAETLVEYNRVHACRVPAVGKRLHEVAREYVSGSASGLRRAMRAIEEGNIAELRRIQEQLRQWQPASVEFEFEVGRIETEFGLSSGG